MQHTMEEKEANYERTQACLENRTCPENAPQQSIRRAQPCVDGKYQSFCWKENM